jgi:hypothetical protein
MTSESKEADQEPILPVDDEAVGGGQFDLERARLLQERHLREKELALKEKELDIQHKQGWQARWSTPAVVAIVAGLIGYVGTLISSYQNRQLEREKQEGTLILEAIKTTGTAEEKGRQTAANLVFLADAGLITSINKVELEKLRVKAQGAGPSLPAPQGIEFKPSSSLTSELQSKLQSALSGYQAWLARLGYNPGQGRDRVGVRVDETLRDNAYFDNQSVVLGVNLARDPEYVLSEYTWYVLKQANPRGFQALWDSSANQFQAFSQGLKFYFTCSYLNDPYVGKNFYSLADLSPTGPKREYLFNLAEFRAFDKGGDQALMEPHKLGEVWGGAFWELRTKFGQEKTDRLIFEAWKRLRPVAGEVEKPKFFVNAIIQTSTAAGNEEDAPTIREAFERRNLN